MNLEMRHSRLAVASCLMPGMAILLLVLIVTIAGAAASADDPSGRCADAEASQEGVLVVLACLTLACPLAGVGFGVLALKDPHARRDSAWCGLIVNGLIGGVLGLLLAAWIYIVQALT